MAEAVHGWTEIQNVEPLQHCPCWSVLDHSTLCTVSCYLIMYIIREHHCKFSQSKKSIYQYDINKKLVCFCIQWGFFKASVAILNHIKDQNALKLKKKTPYHLVTVITLWIYNRNYQTSIDSRFDNLNIGSIQPFSAALLQHWKLSPQMEGVFHSSKGFLAQAICSFWKRFPTTVGTLHKSPWHNLLSSNK